MGAAIKNSTGIFSRSQKEKRRRDGFQELDGTSHFSVGGGGPKKISAEPLGEAEKIKNCRKEIDLSIEGIFWIFVQNFNKLKFEIFFGWSPPTYERPTLVDSVKTAEEIQAKNLPSEAFKKFSWELAG